MSIAWGDAPTWMAAAGGIIAAGQVLVAQSEHAYFSSDSIGLRCTWRFGQNVVRADRIGKFTVTAPA